MWSNILCADVFDSNIKDVALISSIPVSVSIFSEMAAASLTDYFRKKKTIKISNVSTFTSINFFKSRKKKKKKMYNQFNQEK